MAGEESSSATPARRHAPTIRLSVVDQRRLEQSEIASPEEALKQALTQSWPAEKARGSRQGEAQGSQGKTPSSQARAASPRREGGQRREIEPRDAEERRILNERPPHFGKI